MMLCIIVLFYVNTMLLVNKGVLYKCMHVLTFYEPLYFNFYLILFYHFFLCFSLYFCDVCYCIFYTVFLYCTVSTNFIINK